MINPWDVRPQSDMGDRDSEVLFAAIGQALTEWENVESSLAELFAVFVSARGKSTFWKPAILAYGTIISFKSRCDMLRAAGEAYFSTRKHFQGKARNFKELVDRAGNYAARRNEIAHGQVSAVTLFYPRKPPRPGGYHLFPSIFNPKKFKKGTGTTYSYISSDIYHYRPEFTKLHLRIEGFRRELISMRPVRSTVNDRQ